MANWAVVIWGRQRKNGGRCCGGETKKMQEDRIPTNKMKK
jgi:hypothetical protein